MRIAECKCTQCGKYFKIPVKDLFIESYDLPIKSNCPCCNVFGYVEIIKLDENGDE